MTASQYIAEAQAERQRRERIYNRVGYAVVAAFAFAFLMLVAWLALT